MLDARIPLRFGSLADRAPAEAVLTDLAADGLPGAVAGFSSVDVGHAAGCACCLPRTAAASALAGLFRARATGPGVAFTGVLAVVGPAGEAAVRRALASDPVVSARYRLASAPGAALPGAASPGQAGMSASPRPSPRCI